VEPVIVPLTVTLLAVMLPADILPVVVMFPAPVFRLAAVRAPALTAPENVPVVPETLPVDEMFPDTLTGDDMATVPPAAFEDMEFVLVDAKSPAVPVTVPDDVTLPDDTVPAEIVPVVAMFPEPVFRLAAVRAPVLTAPENVPVEAETPPVDEMFPVTEVLPVTASGDDTATAPPPWEEMALALTVFAETSPCPSIHSTELSFPISFAAYLSTKKLRFAVAPGRVTFSVTLPPETCARGRKFGTRDAEAVSIVVVTSSSLPDAETV